MARDPCRVRSRTVIVRGMDACAISETATDGHSISGKLVTRALHATDIPRRDRYASRPGSPSTAQPRSRLRPIVYTVHRNIDNWPLMAVLLPRFETRVVLRTFLRQMHARLHGLLRFVLLHACKLID